MGACDAQSILVSFVHGSTGLGTPIGIQVEQSLDDVIIRGAGKIGPTCPSLVAGDLILLVDFLEKGHIARSASAASCVATYKDGDGDSQTDTWATMLARSVGKTANRDVPPFPYRQRFRHKGDMDTDPWS